MNDADATMMSETRRVVRRARIKYALPPLLFLPAALFTALPFSVLLGFFNYVQVMPILIFIFGVIVMFIGAFWDFGAKMYVKDLMDHHLPFGDTEMNYIFKQQFILTSIYIGIGFLYLASAFIIFFI